MTRRCGSGSPLRSICLRRQGNLTALGELTFDYASGGLVVKKTFRFDASYVVHITDVTSNGSPCHAYRVAGGGIPAIRTRSLPIPKRSSTSRKTASSKRPMRRK